MASINRAASIILSNALRSPGDRWDASAVISVGANRRISSAKVLVPDTLPPVFCWLKAGCTAPSASANTVMLTSDFILHRQIVSRSETRDILHRLRPIGEARSMLSGRLQAANLQAAISSH